jgi:glycosyltransferase involved in cell wall biosynthesis
MTTPKVSVSITAFNHAPFIRLALDGVLAQQTDFPVEILVGEDDSTDGTREIVREYAERFPDRITAFFHDASSKLRIKGRLTGRNNLAHNLNVARGEYIALLDGDDCWTDETKLARQVAQLESDPTLMTSFHHALIIDESGAPMERASTIKKIKDRYTLEEMISGEYEAQTCTVLFRRGAIHPLPPWFFEAPVGDFVIHALNGQRGDFGFIDQAMGCYRMHSGGIWSQGNAGTGQLSPEQIRRTIGRYEMMVDLLGAVAQHSGTPHREAAFKRLGMFACMAAKLGAQVHDKAAIRRNLAAIWKTRVLPRKLDWRTLTRLLIQAV